MVSKTLSPFEPHNRSRSAFYWRSSCPHLTEQSSPIPGESLTFSYLIRQVAYCFRFQVYRESDSLMLSGSKPFALSVVFKQTYPGRYEARLEFIFQDTRLGQPFIITRALKAVVGDKALLHELTPKTPYMPPTESAMKDVKEVIGGAKTAALKAIRYKAKLPQAPIPSPLHDLLSRSEPIAQISKEIKKLFLPESLTTASYRQFFEQLLWVEEMKMEYVPNSSLLYQLTS